MGDSMFFLLCQRREQNFFHDRNRGPSFFTAVKGGGRKKLVMVHHKYTPPSP